MGEETATRLDLVAAIAKQLAMDCRNGSLWEGDLAKGLSEIHEQLRQIPQSDR